MWHLHLESGVNRIYKVQSAVTDSEHATIQLKTIREIANQLF